MVEIFSRANRFRGPVRAVILDWGGTAVDFGSFGNVEPVIEGFKENWVQVTAEEVRRDIGLSTWDHVGAIFRHESVVEKWTDVYGAPPSEYDITKVFMSVESFSAAAAALHVQPVPGLLGTISLLRSEGIRIGSTSSRGFQAVEAISEAVREMGYAPDTIVCSTDVPGGRPFPWMCYQNAINLETYPLESMIKIGDTVFDIQEGLNAGMWTIGVTKTSGELGMSVGEADRADPAELSRGLSRIERRFLDAGAHFVIEGVWDCPRIIQEINRLLAEGERP